VIEKKNGRATYSSPEGLLVKVHSPHWIVMNLAALSRSFVYRWWTESRGWLRSCLEATRPVSSVSMATKSHVFKASLTTANFS